MLFRFPIACHDKALGICRKSDKDFNFFGVWKTWSIFDTTTETLCKQSLKGVLLKQVLFQSTTCHKKLLRSF